MQAIMYCSLTLPLLATNDQDRYTVATIRPTAAASVPYSFRITTNISVRAINCMRVWTSFGPVSLNPNSLTPNRFTSSVPNWALGFSSTPISAPERIWAAE